MQARAASLLCCLLACLCAPASAGSLSSLGREIERAAEEGQDRELRRLVGELVKHDDEDVVDVLLELGTEHPRDYPYRLARYHLAKSLQPAALAKLHEEAREARKLPERLLAVDACAARSDAGSTRALVAALGDDEEPILRIAARAAGARRLVPAVAPLIELYARLSEDERGPSVLERDVQAALLAITGEQFRSAIKWRSFWAARGEGFVPPSGERKELRATRIRPRFFGSEVISNRVVFVIDVSGSMRYSDRLERVKVQLRKLIDELPEEARFQLIAYSGVTVGGRLPPGAPREGQLPEKIDGKRWIASSSRALRRARERNKERATKWLAQLKPWGSTFTSEALLHAFEVKDVDQVVLLSDGRPEEYHRVTGKMLSEAAVLRRVASMNRFRQLRVDTIGLGGRGDAFLKAVAKLTGGTFVPIQ